MSLILALLLFLATPLPTHASSASIPLFHQLLFAYHSTPLSIQYQAHVPTAPTANHQPLAVSVEPIWQNPNSGQVLGLSTDSSLPPIGGDGRIITIAVLGDSMIDTLGADLPQLQAALSQLYPQRQFRLLNYGVGGENIESGFRRLTRDYTYQGQQFSSLLSQNPDIIVIESFAYNNFGNSQTGIDRHWLNLGALTTTIKEKLPRSKIVLAATIAPNSVIFGNGIKDLHFTALEKIEKSGTIKLYLQNLVNFATSQNYPLANAYHPSLINNEGNPKYINASDGLHPSGPGGEFFCRLVAKTIFDNSLIN